MYNTVDDALLRKLSTETQLVGQYAIVKGGAEEDETQAVIMNVIILPFSQFYRQQFMTYYEVYRHNAVKALKELVNKYPNADYKLDIGYVLTTRLAGSEESVSEIRHRSDFMLMEDMASHRQEVFKSVLKLVKKPEA